MFDRQKSESLALTAELTALEQQLARMSPATPRIDRDRLMFAAGHASHIAESSRLGPYVWPAATAFATAASLLLAILLIRDHASQAQTEIAHSATGHATKTIAASTEPDAYIPTRSLRLAPYQTPPGYLGVRYVALTRGVGALDDNARVRNVDTTEATPPVSAKELLRELMPKSENASS
jgi:hypothetical protein